MSGALANKCVELLRQVSIKRRFNIKIYQDMCPNMYRDMTREEDNIDCSIPRIRIDEDGGFVADIRNQLASLNLCCRSMKQHKNTCRNSIRFASNNQEITQIVET